MKDKVHYFTTAPRDNCEPPNIDGYVICTVKTNTFDAADRLVMTTDILGNQTHFRYDAVGNLIERTDANTHTVRYEYDAMNRRTAVVDANGHRTEMSYDLDGRIIATKDANGNITKYEYDSLGRQTKVSTSMGRETQTQYDANGNVTHVTDANAVANLQPKNNQNATIYREYDEFNRLTLERDALNGDTRYTYDLLGNITSINDAEGQVTTFVYDDLGRLIETRDPIVEAGTDKTDKVLKYDEADKVLLSEDRSGKQRRHGILQLQTKLNNYLSYALDGQLAKDYPDLSGKPVRIELHTDAEPDATTFRFFKSGFTDAGR